MSLGSIFRLKFNYTNRKVFDVVEREQDTFILKFHIKMFGYLKNLEI